MVRARGTEGAAHPRSLAADSLVSQSSLPPSGCGVVVTRVVVLVLSRNFWFGCQSDSKQSYRAQPGTGLLNGSGHIGRHGNSLFMQSTQ